MERWSRREHASAVELGALDQLQASYIRAVTCNFNTEVTGSVFTPWVGDDPRVKSRVVERTHSVGRLAYNYHLRRCYRRLTRTCILPQYYGRVSATAGRNNYLATACRPEFTSRWPISKPTRTCPLHPICAYVSVNIPSLPSIRKRHGTKFLSGADFDFFC